ncbi:MAG: hypothetical protein M3167_06295 [Acidobacteriota bacterium]|nr:hypothetical protein [Acidobacteriota bacterium]MDQ6892274.1 hypothetical protein [Acidobacteriota bacterium]
MADVLASIAGTVSFGGACAFAGGIVKQERPDSDAGGLPPSFDEALTFDRALWDAATARVRYTRGRVTFEGSDLYNGRASTAEYVEDMVVGNFRTVRVRPIGTLWSIPTTIVPSIPYDPCPAPPGPVAPHAAPRMWGNLPMQFFLGLGKSPAAMTETKLFEGVTYQKRNKNQVPVDGDLTAVDLSLVYANIPLCYELNPFSGKRRGQITVELAAAVGIPANKVLTPVGGEVTRAILLSNASLLPFLEKLWESEYGFPYFDENGNLVVKRIDMKGSPDFALDSANGDFDLDQFEEIPPSLAPSRVFVSGALPVKNTGPGGTPIISVTSTENDENGLYNPKCQKVRPGGLLSYRQQPDGSGVSQYCIYPSQHFLTVGRTRTEITKTNGIETLRVITKWGFYNPAAKDPNFDGTPATNLYDGAYGDKTFHVNESETFMEISKETTESFLDDNGTLLRKRVTSVGWLAPKAALFFEDPANRGGFRSTGGRWVYGGANGGNARTLPAEIYQAVSEVETTFVFDEDGKIASADAVTRGWGSPQARCDVDTTAPHTLPPEPFPGPGPAPTPPPEIHLSTQLTGPTRREGNRFFFNFGIPTWLDEYLRLNLGGYTFVEVAPQTVRMLGFAVGYRPRNGFGILPLPGASASVTVSGPAINPAATPPVLQTEIYVDLPHNRPTPIGADFRPTFTGDVHLYVAGVVHLTAGGFDFTITADNFPLVWQPYASSSTI